MDKEVDASRVLLRAITPRNILSFGPTTAPIRLDGLNVLIGPNGSGKSNLIDAVRVLRAAPDDLRAVFRRGGGVGDWIWQGAPAGPTGIDAEIANHGEAPPLRHLLAFRPVQHALVIDDERIEYAVPDAGHANPYFFYQYQHGRPVMNVRNEWWQLMRETVEDDQSILSQRRDPETYPEVTYLANVYDKIRVYQDWSFGRNTVLRVPQIADARNDRLEEDFSNLGLFLNRLRRNPGTKRAILNAMKDLYHGIDDLDISIEGGTVQVYFTEGDFTIPATRLSDGTLRYLCLLAILCDPEPPPLICLEEPELGLHPDIIPKVADLLLEASERTQLIVTTHSDILIDALTEYPETVLVCEKRNGQTEIRHLDADHLAVWLRQYRLGELWTRGELGGTRW